ncbi:S-adenosyl-L-methionine-dependent methyltransferase [Peziza echinospora]|nr:S-adenosyl-L-methionine-dependent methyltransferase [Peziza echinospora]
MHTTKRSHPSATTEDTILLLASYDHNIPVLASHLRTTRPTVQEEGTLHTPLHKAVLGCISSSGENSNATPPPPPPSEEKLKQAEETIRLLFENGAIWNDLDREGMTPGCYAYRYGLTGLYELFVDAGVRAELLFSRLDGYLALGGGEEEESDEESEEEEEDGNKEVVEGGDVGGDVVVEEEEEEEKAEPEPEWKDPTPITSDTYLASTLTYHADKLLDDANNGVMMAWETEIMARTVELLLPSPPSPTSPAPSSTSPGPKILNIGFGMGIIDSLFQTHNPALHTICEAHPDVLASRLLHPSSPFNPANNPRVEILPGKWQDTLPALVLRGEVYDAIYFDTFAEDYNALREFFNEYVIALLNPEGGRFGFFNGLGADRQISYDVYKKVVEMDLFEADLETVWTRVDVPDLTKSGVWDGVRRKYWCLKEYWLPVCQFLS